MLRQPSPPQMSSMIDQQQQQTFLTSAVQAATTKEIGRSSSLPVNSTFQSAFVTHKDEFVVPKCSRSRSRQRSDSINLHRTANNTVSGMQSANSEPMLNAAVKENSALRKLLSDKNTNLLTKHSVSSSAVNVQQQQQQQQFQQKQVVKPSLPAQTIQTHLSQAMQQKSLTFPTSAVQNQLQHQTASTGMSSALLSSLKKNILQQQQGFSSPGFSTSSTTSMSISTSTPSLSPDSALDIEMPLSPLSRQTSSSSLKFSLTREGPGRRAGHIHAEQKRRYNIKNGFDMLHSLIPELQNNPNAKLSKAAMLQKGAEYIRQMRIERTNLKERMDVLRKEIDALNNSLSHLQTALPADGAPVSKQRNSRMSELYEAYIRYRTTDNWKYWVFGLIFEPMMQSFNSTVSVASMDDLIRTTNNWVDQHCSLIELRPAVSNKLRSLSTTTDLLAERPTSLQQEVQKAMTKSNSCNSSSSSSG